MLREAMYREVAERATDLIETEGKKFTKKEVRAVLDAFTNCVLENTKEDKTEKIPLPGIGLFSVKHVDERSGKVALAGGKEWHKDACDQLKFTISRSVKTLD